jgi:hypothetical protein
MTKYQFRDFLFHTRILLPVNLSDFRCSCVNCFHFRRLFFEIVASIVIVGDAVVTWSTLNGALRSSSTFMAQFALPHWLTRTLLVLVVCSSYSTPAEAFISKTWSPYLASVYSCKYFGISLRYCTKKTV